MFSIRLYRKILFYLLFFIFLAWIVIEPTIVLTPEDATLVFLFVFLVHAFIDKKYLLRKLCLKFDGQHELIHNLFMNCPDLVYYKDSNLKYQECNPATKRMLNVKNDEDFRNKNDFDFFPKETAETIRIYEKRVIEKGQIVSYKIAKKEHDGTKKVYDTLMTPLLENNNIKGVLGVMRDITQNEELQERLLIKNVQLNAILDNMPFILYIKDLKGKLITGNKKLEEYLNCSREEMVGKAPEDTHLINYANDIQKEDYKVIRNREEIFIEKQVTGPDGKISWFNAIKAPICNSNNDVIGIIVVIKNVDKEKQIENQKEDFVATLTHDLKTPTNAQITAINLLLKETFGKINDEQRDMLEQTLNSNKYMSDMISTILATYKNDNGKTVLKIEELDIFELVNATCKEVSYLAKENDLNLILSSKIENNMVYADILQLKRVIVNLVANAISYAFKGTDIEITIENEDENIIFKVKNKSKYIPEEKLKMLFEKYQTGAAAKFNKISTGLGLYLSKQIIDAHSGELHAKSFKDDTNIFGFVIPKKAVPAKQEIK